MITYPDLSIVDFFEVGFTPTSVDGELSKDFGCFSVTVKFKNDGLNIVDISASGQPGMWFRFKRQKLPITALNIIDLLNDAPLASKEEWLQNGVILDDSPDWYLQLPEHTFPTPIEPCKTAYALIFQEFIHTRKVREWLLGGWNE